MDVEEHDALGSETDGSSEEDEDYAPKENQPLIQCGNIAP